MFSRKKIKNLKAHIWLGTSVKVAIRLRSLYKCKFTEKICLNIDNQIKTFHSTQMPYNNNAIRRENFNLIVDFLEAKLHNIHFSVLIT
jgi:hypothetical protein